MAHQNKIMVNLWWTLIVLFTFFNSCVADETCYPPGGVAGIVVATIIVTFVVGGLGAAVTYKLWTRRKGHTLRDTVDCPPPKQSQKSCTEFAFDNPYFQGNDGDQGDKGKARTSVNNKNSLRGSKVSDLSVKGKKSRTGKNFMFGAGYSKKHRALDDSCLSVEPERTIVSLRGHDFTGLGFNICGNMRDGILVKDVLHRGPANESGLIKAGDKILNVTVSFQNIVYEDALTILSYASPYDVQIEIERFPDKSRAVLPSSPSGSKRLGSCSFNNSGQKLFHPLYRSQSIDDLTQIDKDTFPSHGIGPRRSQSVGVAAHKLAAHFKNSDSKLDDKDLNTILSTTGSLNEKMLANVMSDGSNHKNGLQWEKRFEDTLESEDSGSNNDTQITNIDVSKHSNKSPGILKNTKVNIENNSDSDDLAQNVQNIKHNSKYLDSPHVGGKLEPFKSSGIDKSEMKNDRAKTMADASHALWHLDQSIKNSDISDHDGSRSSPWNQPKRDEYQAKNSTSINKNNRYTKREDDDSDVSNDSLEISSKKRGIRKSKKSCSIQESDTNIDKNPTQEVKIPNSMHKPIYQHKPSKKNSYQNEIKNKTAENSNTERVYVNNIMNKSVLLQSSSPGINVEGKIQKSDRELYQDSKQAVQVSHHNMDHKQPAVYANHRDIQDNINIQSQTIINESNYSKVNGRNVHGERQKLSSSDVYTQNYGCANRIIINGESDEHKKIASNSKTVFTQKSAAPTYHIQDDIAKNDSDTRYLDKNKSNANQKFPKKSSHPAGMFTQINPFQQPSRQKNTNFKIWTGREDIRDSGLNVEDNSFSSSVSNSYTVYDSSNPKFSNESQNYGQRMDQVTKTILISPYETSSGRSGAQNSPVNYRQQHK